MRDAFEVVVGDHVRLLPGADEPALEVAVVAMVMRRDAAQERPRQVNLGHVGVGVPGGVMAEVVRRPRVGRKHDEDPRAACLGRLQDERRRADAAVLAGKPREVEAGREVADMQRRGAVATRPVQGLGLRHRNAAHAKLGRVVLRPRPEQLQLEGAARIGQRELGRLARAVAPLRKPGDDRAGRIRVPTEDERSRARLRELRDTHEDDLGDDQRAHDEAPASDRTIKIHNTLRSPCCPWSLTQGAA